LNLKNFGVPLSEVGSFRIAVIPLDKGKFVPLSDAERKKIFKHQRAGGLQVLAKLQVQELVERAADIIRKGFAIDKAAPAIERKRGFEGRSLTRLEAKPA